MLSLYNGILNGDLRYSRVSFIRMTYILCEIFSNSGLSATAELLVDLLGVT